MNSGLMRVSEAAVCACAFPTAQRASTEWSCLPHPNAFKSREFLHLQGLNTHANDKLS